MIGLGVAFLGTLVLAACAPVNQENERLHGQGYTVVIRFDQNGGVVASAGNMNVFDRYHEDDVERGVKLLEPGDADRGNVAHKSIVSRRGYFLIGWYREIYPSILLDGSGNAVLDEKGNEIPLDEDGNRCNIEQYITDEKGDFILKDPEYDANGNIIKVDPEYDANGNLLNGELFATELVSVTGKTQAFSFGGRWDFEKDICTLEDVTQTDEKGNTYYEMTLYAAWAPNFSYSYWYEAEGGEWVQYGTSTLPADRDSIAIPSWNESAGTMSYPNNAMKRSGYTIEGVYADKEMNQPFTDVIPHYGETDLETGTAKNTIVDCYTTWRAGDWYHIRTAEQLVNNFTASGSYEIYNDITIPENDNKIYWRGNLANFTGTFKSADNNVYTISGIASSQTSSNDLTVGGVFGSIGSGAVIENVNFENISFNIENGTTRMGGNYGLLAGRIEAGATFRNVHVSGTIYLGDLPLNTTSGKNDGYAIGLLSGNTPLHNDIVGEEEIAVRSQQVPLRDSGNNTFNGWAVIGTVGVDGYVTVTANPTPKEDPNPTTGTN